MAAWARARLVLLAAALLLWLVPWPAQAGTVDDPEITDPAGDPEVEGTIPIGPLFPLSDGVDLLKGWVDNETATDVVLAIQVGGDITLLSPLLTYDFEFHVTTNGTEKVAGAHWAGSFSATGIASAVAAEGDILRLTVPKEDLDAFRGDALSGLFVTSTGVLVTNPVNSQLDRAPDTGTATRGYNLTQGTARGGTATDNDADGLPDADETAAFGSIDAQNGTGDPDGDGLDDGDDSAPLDATKPADADGDGLTDSWERTHFTTTAAQDGKGDPDADGLNNTRELALGTDPNEADTDGGGTDDGDDSAPLDPAVGDGGAAADEAYEPEPELYAGAGMFAIAATFILLGLAKGL